MQIATIGIARYEIKIFLFYYGNDLQKSVDKKELIMDRKEIFNINSVPLIRSEALGYFWLFPIELGITIFSFGYSNLLMGTRITPIGVFTW